MTGGRIARTALIVVLIVVVVAYVAISVRWGLYVSAHLNHPVHPRVGFTACEPHLKSGDIVLFIRYHQYPYSPILSNHLYNHVGMLMRHAGRLYVAETARMFSRDGVHEHKEMYEAGSSESRFRKRFADYPGSVFVMRLGRPLTPRQKRLMCAAVDDVRPFPPPHRVLAGVLKKSAAGRTQHCAQRVMYLLDAMGLNPTSLIRQGKTLAGATSYLGGVKAVAGLEGMAVGARGANWYGRVHELVNDVGLVPPHRMG